MPFLDYGSTGIQHSVTTTGTSGEVTAYSALHPDACAPTRSLLETTCFAKSAACLYLDLDVWLHNPRNCRKYMRGASVIDSHPVLRKYALSICTFIEYTPYR